MRYKIEIWQYHRKVDTYTSDDINEVLEWYKYEWEDCYDNGGCMFYIFDNDKQLLFDEMCTLGFFWLKIYF